MNSEYVNIDDKVVDLEIIQKHFVCDLEKCKGGCCTMKSDFGAPLNEKEIAKISKNLDSILEILPNQSKKEIEANGFWEEKNDIIMTRSINKRDCVFVYRENGIAKCGIEKAYFNGKSNFRKPISCFLFPIRVKDFGGEILRYEFYEECKPALELGMKKKITVAEFCKEALKEAFGIKWYNKLKSYLE